MHRQIITFLDEKTLLWGIFLKYDYSATEAALTHRVIRSTCVHASTFFQGHALVIAEDEAWVTLTTLHTCVLTARWADHTHARFWTGTHAQRVGAVGGTVQGFMEKHMKTVITKSGRKISLQYLGESFIVFHNFNWIIFPKLLILGWCLKFGPGN